MKTNNGSDFTIPVGFVVYHPGDLLIERIKMILEHGCQVYLFDNSPKSGHIREIFQHDSNFSYYTLGRNVGLGIGMSTICAQAYYDNHKSLVFFDQDTGFSDITISYINKFLVYHNSRLSEFSMVSFNAKNVIEEQPSRYNYDLIETNIAINSGSVLMLDALDNIGWHDVTYFVDGVDYKFCLDSVVNKYKIGECKCTPGFDHVTEQDDSLYSFCGMPFLARKYSRRRVFDSLTSLVRLICSSVINLRWDLALLFTKYLLAYVLTQTYVRLVEAFKELKAYVKV